MTAETSRPSFHFAPRRNWMNDPNGLVLLDGEYHLFFQYNPEGEDWGNMSWGHATSTDLLSWSEHEVALPYTEEEQVFSGSVVADHGNTSGFGGPGATPLVAIYTSVATDARQAQALAYSLDRGMTWSRYEGNPVLDRASTAFRDPKVFRAADRDGRERWVMVAVEAEDRLLLVYSSDDLRRWTFESSFGPYGDEGVVWECPDLFAVPVDDGSPSRWVLVLSTNAVPVPDSASYSFVGRFDGHTFLADDPEHWQPLDHGPDFYAAVSFDNTPAAQRVILGWADNWRYAAEVPTVPWRGMMSLPRQLELESPQVGGGGFRLVQRLPEVTERALPGEPDWSHRSDRLDGRLAFDAGQHYRCRMVWQLGDATAVGAELLAGPGESVLLRFDVRTRELSLDRSAPSRNGFHPSFRESSTVTLAGSSSVLDLDVFVDGCLVEVFADQGAATITMQSFPAPDAGTLVLFAESTGAPAGVSAECFRIP